MKLRPNSIVQELVDEFQKARPVILQLGRDVQITKDGREQGSKKRKWDDTDLEEVEEVVKNGLGRRKTRSQNQRRSASRDRGAETIEDQKDGDSRPGRACTRLTHVYC